MTEKYASLFPWTATVINIMPTPKLDGVHLSDTSTWGLSSAGGTTSASCCACCSGTSQGCRAEMEMSRRIPLVDDHVLKMDYQGRWYFERGYGSADMMECLRGGRGDNSGVCRRR